MAFPIQLAREVVRDAMPLGRRLFAAAGEALTHAWQKTAGEEVERRLSFTRTLAGESGTDPFGLDVEWAKWALGVVWFLHRKYFRCEVIGVENVPDGKVLLIANHSGQIPLDGAMIGASVFFDRDRPRIVRSMVEKWVQLQPFVAVLFTRVGQVVGVPENARRLLELGEPILVFPEGAKGISKPFSERYQMTEFGLGFMRLALETKTPIVPVAVVGAEEQYVNLANLGGVAKAVGMPTFPLIPQWFIPGFQLPLPTKYKIYFGEPMTFEGDPDDDDQVVEEKVYVVKQTIQSMLNRGLRERKGIFF